jgi:hypothetical protein
MSKTELKYRWTVPLSMLSEIETLHNDLREFIALVKLQGEGSISVCTLCTWASMW